MRAATLLLPLLLTYCVASVAPVRAQGALGPGSAAPTPTTSDEQKTVAVNSNTQSQANATVYFALPAIGAVIQQSLLSRPVPGQRATVASLSSDSCEPAACGDPWGWLVWVQGGGGQSINSLAVGGYNL